jgi:hypothetical protein
MAFISLVSMRGSDKAKEEIKICGSISLFMKATIPGTHGKSVKFTVLFERTLRQTMIRKNTVSLLGSFGV